MTSVDPISLVNLDSITEGFPALILGLLKGGLVLFLISYFIVSLVVIKQIYMMTTTIKSKNDFFIVFLGYLHSLVVALMLLFTLRFL